MRRSGVCLRSSALQASRGTNSGRISTHQQNTDGNADSWAGYWWQAEFDDRHRFANDDVQLAQPGDHLGAPVTGYEFGKVNAATTVGRHGVYTDEPLEFADHLHAPAVLRPKQAACGALPATSAGLDYAAQRVWFDLPG